MDKIKIAAILLTSCSFGDGFAQIDYFPDFQVVDQPIGLESSYALNAVKAAQVIPDDSGRMVAVRSFNRMYMINANQSIGVFHNIPGDSATGAGKYGLNSFVFHPDFAVVGEEGYGKYYTLTGDTDVTVPVDFATGNTEVYHYSLAEWTMDDIASNTFSGSGRELIRFGGRFDFHTPSDIEFGPDGLLYLSTGEDTITSHSQNTESVFGKILRIDPFGTDSANGNYGIPSDNPFGNEVYAYGLRNPYRISFDPATGSLFTGEVGSESIEEINIIESGANFGWPAKEGVFVSGSPLTPDDPDPATGQTLAQTQGLTDPVFQFDHTDGLSVIGGFVYGGSQFPWLVGKYVFGSWPDGDLYFGDPATGDVQLFLAKGAVKAFSGGAAVAIEEDLDGEILLWGTKKATRIVATSVTLQCDADSDGDCEHNDLDALYDSFGVGDQFDYNGDGLVDGSDIAGWLADASQPSNLTNQSGKTYTMGDINLDGAIDSTDLGLLLNSFGASGEAYWIDGNLNGDSVVDSSDLGLVLNNFGFTSATAVPEPGTLGIAVLFFFSTVVRLRKPTK